MDLKSPRWIILLVICIVTIASVAWPYYRKFFINEWRERMVSTQPVIFIPDCPTVSANLTCGDKFTVAFRRQENNRWCTRVRKNTETEEFESCGVDIDAWDFAWFWRTLTIQNVRLYWSWRGRVLSSPNQTAGWLITPENFAFRNAHPLAVN
jgi:hypothetical protein